MAAKKPTQEHFRVAIVGANRMRVSKVVSLLSLPPVTNATTTPAAAAPTGVDAALLEAHVAAVNDNGQQQQQVDDGEQSSLGSLLATNPSVVVDYLPCVATFGSYEDENGKPKSYLATLQYHGKDGKQPGSSLAPFFDDDEIDNDNANGQNKEQQQQQQRQEDLLFATRGVHIVAVGCGIEQDEQVRQIETFFRTLSGVTDGDETNTVAVPKVHVVRPNPEFVTMKEETNAYKQLDVTEKEHATRLGTIGPGKMAKFVQQVTDDVLRETIQDANKGKETNSHGLLSDENGIGTDKVDNKLDGNRTKGNDGSNTDSSSPIDPSHATNQTDPTENETVDRSTSDPILPEPVDPNQTRYACRMCRQVLFGEADLEDPPHVPAQHTFHRRRSTTSRGGNSSSPCQSLFLGQDFPWMGDVSAFEGKFNCPFCQTKLGTFKWGGAQCSCGTWVTPAIQVPLSKVDVLLPQRSGLSYHPPGTVISPLIVQPPQH